MDPFAKITRPGDDAGPARRLDCAPRQPVPAQEWRDIRRKIMTRIILVFGSISGLIVAALMVGSIALSGPEHSGSGAMFVGYLFMLVALSFIFVAVKRHRDVNLGGTIRFWPALAIGLGITLVAGLIYVIAWDLYFNLSGREFMDVYLASQIEAQREAGASEAEIAAFEAEMIPMMSLYENWWFRMPITFTEIAPVGILVAILSAAILRNPGVLPRRA
jgi:hypothetical protein